MFNAVVGDGEVVAVVRKDEVANVGTVLTTDTGRRFLRGQGNRRFVELGDQPNAETAEAVAVAAAEAEEAKDQDEREAGLLAAGATPEAAAEAAAE